MSSPICWFKCAVLVLVLGVGLLASRSAAACYNDVDCPNPACGGQVCDWNQGLICVPAGGTAKGRDGWCTSDIDCKCMGLGATCVAPYCTFTLPSQAPGAGGAGGGTTGAGGSTGTGGATSGPDAGTTSSGGGGCSVGGTAPLSLVGLMAALGALLAFRLRGRPRVQDERDYWAGGGGGGYAGGGGG